MITDFLKQPHDPADLAAALKVLRAFKANESTEEWLAIRFMAWAKLEQLEEFLAHLVEGKPLEEDTVAYMKQESAAAGPKRTIFECRTCQTCCQGWSDGAFAEPGWNRVEGIDGPNAICPECSADPGALSDLRAAGYPNACIVSGIGIVPGTGGHQ